MRHALITGAAGGIGSAIAHQLAAQGFALTLSGRRIEPLQQLADSLERAQAIACDVGDEHSVQHAFETACSHFGDIDVLINNAGSAPSKPFHKLRASDWRAVMAVNLDGVFHCCAQVAPRMRERQDGRIINIASTASLKGYPYVSAYCAAKHGVLGLTRALALELASSNVTVNAICPGYTDTDLIRDAITGIMAKTGRTEADVLAEFTRVNPQGRLIQPNEVANTVQWLCSDGARSVTGQAIAISGGETM